MWTVFFCLFRSFCKQRLYHGAAFIMPEDSRYKPSGRLHLNTISSADEPHMKHTPVWDCCGFHVGLMWVSCAFDPKLSLRWLDSGFHPIPAFSEPGNQHSTDIVAGCIK